MRSSFPSSFGCGVGGRRACAHPYIYTRCAIYRRGAPRSALLWQFAEQFQQIPMSIALLPETVGREALSRLRQILRQTINSDRIVDLIAVFGGRIDFSHLPNRLARGFSKRRRTPLAQPADRLTADGPLDGRTSGHRGHCGCLDAACSTDIVDIGDVGDIAETVRMTKTRVLAGFRPPRVCGMRRLRGRSSECIHRRGSRKGSFGRQL